MAKSKKFQGVQASDEFVSGVVHTLDKASHRLVSVKLNGHSVSPKDMATIRDLVKSRKLGVYLHTNPRHDPVYVGQGAKPGFVLQHRSKNQTYVRFEGIVVHEAIHAALDLHGGKSPYMISNFDNESIAFVSESIYLHRSGVLASEMTDDPILVAAYAVARHILTKTDLGNSLAELKSVLQRQHYKDKPVNMNGIATVSP
jgi:hypothetical protein